MKVNKLVEYSCCLIAILAMFAGCDFFGLGDDDSGKHATIEKPSGIIATGIDGGRIDLRWNAISINGCHQVSSVQKRISRYDRERYGIYGHIGSHLGYNLWIISRCEIRKGRDIGEKRYRKGEDTCVERRIRPVCIVRHEVRIDCGR